MGKLIFVTDTSYVKQNFSKLKVNHILCEANYSKELLNKDEVKSNHVLTGHMCIDTACDFIRANDSSQLRNVVLLHLSQGNADRDMFLEKAQGITKSNVYIAERGLTVDLSEVPF
jgi:ribonuclease BN (tRNA processing enzyme)